MSSIKKLTLKLKSGLLSDLQSDTVMGHFCWRLVDRFGEDKLKDFIKLYRDNNPVFTISDGLLSKNGEIFFPKPLIHFKPANEKVNSKKEKILKFQINKELKSKQLLTLKQFNLLLNGKINELYNALIANESEYPKYFTDLRTSVEIDRQKMSSKEGQLFSYYPKFLDENTRVVFLVKVLNQNNFDNFQCEQILKDVFEIGYGKKKSSGYGQFEVVSFIDFKEFEEPSRSSGFVTLGNYLPSEMDNIAPESNYDFIVKYGKLGEEKSLSENPFKKPLILFTPGSVFYTDKAKPFYGRITDFELGAVQFCMPFTLNLVL